MTHADVSPLDARRLSAALRERGSLKWTATTAEVAAWVAESDLGTAPAVTEAVVAAVGRGLTGYLPPALRTELSEAAAQWHRTRYGWDVEPARIHPVADVLEALRITVEHLTPPGSAVVVPTPAYMPFLTAPRTWGREVVQVPMLQDGGVPRLDLDRIAAELQAGAGLVVLVDPHNPTGRAHERAELLALAEVVDRYGATVFADAIHAPLTLPGAQHVPYASVSPAAAQHTVTATSASKAWNVPGLKCAQVLLTSDAHARTWRPLDHVLTHGASTIGVLANTAAYRDGIDWLDDLLRVLDRNRDCFATILRSLAPEIVHRPAEGTYLAWLDLRAAPALRDGRPRDLGRWVREHSGVEVVDGRACGEVGAGFVRVNLAMPEPLVAAAATRLAAATT